MSLSLPQGNFERQVTHCTTLGNLPCRGNFSLCEQNAKVAPARVVVHMLIINVWNKFFNKKYQKAPDKCVKKVISLLKSLGMIDGDGDTKYLDDEAMDFVFRQTKAHNTTTSSIVRNQGIPETSPPPPPPQSQSLFTQCLLKTTVLGLDH